MIPAIYNDLQEEILTDCAENAASEQQGEITLPAFVIKGDFEEASAKLKATLDANDARFNANLQTMFKPPPPKDKPAAPAARTTDAWGTSTSRRDDRDSSGFGGRPRITVRTPSK
ncbi:MAG: hypothetical protein HY543_12880 [Deltaproteobacteria bacterium]|nr:hypothetical protein [Deltaproteobacteria bacterium]